MTFHINLTARHTVALLLLAAGPIAACASEWKFEQRSDAITDEVVKHATLASADGDVVTVIRRSDESVWIFLTLRKFETFSTQQEMIGRVDKNEPIQWGEKENEFYRKIGMKVTMWEWNPNMVGGRAWHGKADEGCGFIKQLATGKRLVMRYYPNKSTVADVVFDLPKSSSPLLKALDLKLSDCADAPPKRSSD